MNIVSYPAGLKEQLLETFGQLLEDGSVAEGRFYNDTTDEFVKGKRSIPVNSCGSALFALLAYQKIEKGKTIAILQSNTMRGLYTVPRLLDFEVRVVASTRNPGFMAMDPDALRKELETLGAKGLTKKVVILYSVIGGYLAPAYKEIESLAKELGIPLIIDLAHGHYLDEVIATDYGDLAFSFYATKILPAGEGGLVSTPNPLTYEWLRAFLIYDRFSYKLDVGINLRPNELTSYFIYLLMTERKLREFFMERRVAIAKVYRQTCEASGIDFLDPEKAMAYNGYKFVIFSPHDVVAKKNSILTVHQPTSPVFNVDVVTKKALLPHWCPPTYPSLFAEIVGEGHV